MLVLFATRVLEVGRGSSSSMPCRGVRHESKAGAEVQT